MCHVLCYEVHWFDNISTCLVQDRDKRQAFLNTVMNLEVP